MSLDDAQHFVLRMREDGTFRNEVKRKSGGNSLPHFLRQSGYNFKERELVVAMAGCMDEMEKM